LEGSDLSRRSNPVNPRSIKGSVLPYCHLDPLGEFLNGESPGGCCATPASFESQMTGYDGQAWRSPCHIVTRQPVGVRVVVLRKPTGRTSICSKVSGKCRKIGFMRARRPSCERRRLN